LQKREDYINNPDYQENPGLVITYGTLNLRCGYTSYDAPSYVGQFGHDFANPFGKTGQIEDFDKMVDIWENVFRNEFNQASNSIIDVPVYLSEPAGIIESNQNKIIEIFFEKFNCSKFSTFNEQELSLFSSGRTTGTIVDIGENFTVISPIYEGLTLKHARTILNYGGSDISNYLAFLLKDNEIMKCSDWKKQFTI